MQAKLDIEKKEASKIMFCLGQWCPAKGLQPTTNHHSLVKSCVCEKKKSFIELLLLIMSTLFHFKGSPAKKWEPLA